MSHYINKHFATLESPTVSSKWSNATEDKRIELVYDQLKKNVIYKNFAVVQAQKDGKVTLRIEESIPAAMRGLMLLELEELLKNFIDKGVTVWLEPVGDKSKLRQLRGIKIIAEKL
jgi:hypothetical protein